MITNEMLLFHSRGEAKVGGISGEMTISWLMMVTCLGFAMVPLNAPVYTFSYLPGTL